MLDLDQMFGLVPDLGPILMCSRDCEVRPEIQRALYLMRLPVRSAREAPGKPVTVDRDVDRFGVGYCKFDVHVVVLSRVRSIMSVL